MQLLLETHAFLWFANGDDRLSRQARSAIADPANAVFISAGSLWEMAIKISLDKLRLTQPLDVWVGQQLVDNEMTVLGIRVSHLARVAALPFHHRDPFDRLLVAQAEVEQLKLVSEDVVMDTYGVERLW